MCVIAVATKKAVHADDLTRMAVVNDDGAGVAYRRDGRVYWKKGLTLEECLTLSPTLPFPHIWHFRLASCGGKYPELTHPFPFDLSPELEGDREDGVLFHNGHWNGWETAWMMATLVAGADRLPPGRWSDSRVMAFMYSMAPASIQLLPATNKLVVFTPEDIVYYGDGWTHKEDEGYSYSNLTWETSKKGGWRKPQEPVKIYKDTNHKPALLPAGAKPYTVIKRGADGVWRQTVPGQLPA